MSSEVQIPRLAALGRWEDIVGVEEVEVMKSGALRGNSGEEASRVMGRDRTGRRSPSRRSRRAVAGRRRVAHHDELWRAGVVGRNPTGVGGRFDCDVALEAGLARRLLALVGV